MPRPPQYVGVSEIAEDLDVAANTVLGWIRDFDQDSDHPFPQDDEATTNSAGHTTRKWRKSRLPEIRRWYKNKPVKPRSIPVPSAPEGHVGVRAVAADLDVDGNTLRSWIEDYADDYPFPEPDRVVDNGGKLTRYWREERLPEIRDWHEKRPRRKPGMPRGTKRPDVAERRTKPIPEPYTTPYADYRAALAADGSSVNSQKNYTGVASHFLRWAAKEWPGNVLELTEFDELLEQYETDTMGDMSSVGRRTYRTKAKRFLTWHQEHGKAASTKKRRKTG